MKRHFKEPIIVFLIAILINVFFLKDDPAYLSFRFHPYLFITVLFAVRYGIWEGALSGIIAAAHTLWAITQKADFLETELLFGLRELSLPFILVVIGVLIGENIESRKNKLKYFKEALVKESSSRQQVSQSAKGLEDTLLEFEKKLAGQGLGISDFSNNLNLFPGMSRENIYKHIMLMLEKFLHIEKSIILLSFPDIHHQKPMLSDHSQIQDEVMKAIKTQDMYHQALHEGKVLSISDKIFTDGPLQKIEHPIYYSGPVFKSDNEIDALVLVMKVPFIHFNVSNFRLFEIILQSASAAISQMARYNSLYKAAPYHQDWPVERDHYFFKNLNFILQTRDNIDIYLVGFEYSDGIGEKMREGLMMLLAQLCVLDGVRVGYIEPLNWFAIYREDNIRDNIAMRIHDRFVGYGIAPKKVRLLSAHTSISSEQSLRENEYLVSLLEKALHSEASVS